MQKLKQARTKFAVLAAVLSIPLMCAAEPTPVSTWQAKSGTRWFFQDLADIHSPRATQAVTGPDYQVYDHDGAVLDLAKDLGLTLQPKMTLTDIDAWRRLNGSNLKAGLTRTTIDGADFVIFMTVTQPKNSDQFNLYAVALPTTTFYEWGGITWMMADNGLIPSTEIFPTARRRQIAKAPYATQMQLFAEAATVKVNVLAKQMNELMSQQMLTNQMLDLNLDLMFGDLAVSPIGE
ncbi:MAG: hypothetical protein AAGJ86_01360 [Pseudomonadota bacterium]